MGSCQRKGRSFTGSSSLGCALPGNAAPPRIAAMRDRVQFVVHPSIYDGEAGHLPAIYSDLKKAVRLDLRHHFSGPICANYWLSLCGAEEYRHAALVNVVGTKAGEAFHALKAST